jgi:hypothetical protein
MTRGLTLYTLLASVSAECVVIDMKLRHKRISVAIELWVDAAIHAPLLLSYVRECVC